MITGGEAIGFLPMMVLSCKHQASIAKAHEVVVGDLRIVPMSNTFIVELTYLVKKEKKSLSKCVSLDLNETLVCDLSVDNFATIVSSKPSVNAFLIKCKVLKSIN